ncbi:MAG: Na+/H+ antiporter subunit E [Deltaproteobacteria bacterium]|nr:Na+/H+ antiporter subunit E [Deltaproteobacteria bacterium]
MQSPERETRDIEEPDTRSPGLTKGNNQAAKRRVALFLFTFLILFSLWLLLSGRFDSFHIALGIISCLIISFISGDLLFDPHSKVGALLVTSLGFIGYIPWLLYQIFLANLHLMYLSFHPRMMELIDPKIVRFKSRLKSDLSLVTFANSITLTPGTITVYVSIDGNFSVHAIDMKSSEGLPGEMEERIARAFSEV